MKTALIINIVLIFQKNAFAYLDPGTGSMIIQSIIAGIAAGLYFISSYFFKIKLFITKKIFRKK